MNAHYASPGNRADAGKQRYYASVYIRIPNTPFRVLATIPYTGPTGTCLKIGRATICRWFGKAKQVVDGVPEEAVHEQELGHLSHHEIAFQTQINVISRIIGYNGVSQYR